MQREHPGWRALIGGMAGVVATLGLGCAWFEEPGPDAVADAPVRAERISPPPARPSPGEPRTADSTRIDTLAPDTLTVPRTGVAGDAAPEDTVAGAVPRIPGAEPVASTPDTGTVSSPVSLEGPDEWKLDGDNLRAVTEPSGQVIHIDQPVITHRGLEIRAIRGRYEVDGNRATLSDDVRFEDRGLRGSSRSAIYDREAGILTADGEVWVENDTLEVTSDHATYDPEANTIHLSGDVEGRRGSREMSSREADWRRDRDEVLLTGRVVVTDSTDNSRLTGEEVLYDILRDRATVTDSPQLLLRSENNLIRIDADRMWVDPDGNAQASGNVRVLRGGVTALSDSATFFSGGNRALLLGDPRVMDRDGTLTGDTLSLFFDDLQAIDRVEVHGNAGVRFAPEDSLGPGEVSTVRGDSLTMYFEDQTADHVVVFGHAQSTYRPSPRDLSKGAGTNSVKGDSITIFLEEGLVQNVKVNGGAKGVFTFVERPADPDSAATGPGSPPGTGADSAGVAAPDSLESYETARPSDQKVLYTAREVLYSLNDRRVDLEGGVSLDYGVLTLTAGKVRFYADRRYLDAENNPILIDREGTGGQSEVVGERMDYNLETREGTIDQGRTKAEDGFIYADRLRQIGEGQFLAKNGNFTTCDYVGEDKDPHFHFTSNRMRIYLNDKVVAKPVTLYIRDIPILAIPFYVFSVRKGRQSGFLTPDFDFGLGSNTGRFFRNLGYYWAASEYYDFTLSADYQDKPSRFVGRLDTRYAKRYLMSGQLNLARTLGSGQSQYDVVGAHQMTLGDWRVTGRAEFRDSQFRNDEPLSGDFGARLDRILISDVSASRSFPFGASLSLTARQQKNLATDPTDLKDETVVTETLPRYSFSLSSRPLGKLPDEDGTGGRLPGLASLRFSFTSSGSSVRTEQERTTFLFPDSATTDTTFALISDRVSGARHAFSLSDTRRILGAFNLSPSLNLTENWVDREFSAADTVKKFGRAAVWSATMSANSTLYGTVGGIGPVESIRHVFRPSASFTYQPEFSSLSYQDTSGVRRSRFPGVFASERRRLGLSIDNSLQAKVRSGEEVRRVDLLRWTLSSGYDFVVAESGERAWENVRSVVDLSSIYGVGLNFNSTHDPYHQFRFQDFQVTGSYSLGGVLPGGTAPNAYTNPDPDPEARPGFETLGADTGLDRTDRVGSRPASDGSLAWNAGFSFSYGGSRSFEEVLDPTASINGRFSAQLTENWSLDYSNRWDVTEGKILGDNLSLRRDLHCWEAQFSRSRLGDDTTFYFRINVKNLSDLKYEQGRYGGSGLGSVTRLLP